MAILKVLKCSECTRPLKEGQTKCSCGAINKFVQADVNPLKMTNQMAQEYIAVFKQKAEENPKDTNALFAMGLFYLGLKNYELAQRNFKMAVDLQPTEPDMYYYYALSLFEGKSPNAINAATAERIEEWLHTATNIQGKRKYLILLMILRQGAFLANGLQVHGESPEELFEKIQQFIPEPDELVEIEQHLNISDPKNIEYLQILKGEAQKVQKERNTDCEYLNSFRATVPTQRDSDELPENWHEAVKRLEDPQERENFFNYMYPPSLPVKYELPSYPIGNMIKRLVIMVVVSFVFLLVSLMVGYSMKDIEPRDPNLTVNKEYKELYGKKKMSSKQRREAMAELRNDSIEAAREDSIFFADYFLYAYRMTNPADPENEDAEIVKFCFNSVPDDVDKSQIRFYGGFKKGYESLITLLFLLSPLIIFLIKTSVRFGRVSKERREVKARNISNAVDYMNALDIHNSRALILDYVDFCREFLSKSTDVTELGDPVTQTLRACNIFDEKDVPGKILFVNYYAQYDNQDKSRQFTDDPYHVLDRVYYVVAVPQRDCLILNWNYWDTYRNELQPCDTTTLYYRNINSISRQENNIIIEMNGTQKEIFLGPYGMNLMSYQSSDNLDETTFSLTRTGNPNEFINAVNQLINAFHRNNK